MIYYRQQKFHPRSFFQAHGSVFPFGLAVSLPCAFLAATLKFLVSHDLLDSNALDIVNEANAYSSFTFLVGFFIVFRTQQAYNRFHQGAVAVHEMRGEWFDAASSLVAFCKYSSQDPTKILRFQHKLIRLFSMLHAVALADLEGEADGDGLNASVEQLDSRDFTAFRLPLIDAKGIDTMSLLQIRSSDSKVELIFQWIQQLCVENISTGVLNIPPPILTRAFQELASGMVKYHDALVISRVPFPFPYMQTAEVLLMLHWIFTPLLMAAWTEHPGWAFAFCFVSVLFFWCLNAVACELENPFGHDANDLNAMEAQRIMNNRLVMLVRPGTLCTPTLVDGACLNQVDFEGSDSEECFLSVWQKLEDQLPPKFLQPIGVDLDITLNEFFHHVLSESGDLDYHRHKKSPDNLKAAIYDQPRTHTTRMTAMVGGAAAARSSRAARVSSSSNEDDPMIVSRKRSRDITRRHVEMMESISLPVDFGNAGEEMPHSARRGSTSLQIGRETSAQSSLSPVSETTSPVVQKTSSSPTGRIAKPMPVALDAREDAQEGGKYDGIVSPNTSNCSSHTKSKDDSPYGNVPAPDHGNVSNLGSVLVAFAEKPLVPKPNRMSESFSPGTSSV